MIRDAFSHIPSRGKRWRLRHPVKAQEGDRVQNEKRYRKLTYEERRYQRLKTKYKITLEQLRQKLKDQEFLCAICKQEISLDKHPKACVDHNHSTNKVRDLLCVPCNAGLGNAKENIDILNSMIKYIEKHRE